MEEINLLNSKKFEFDYNKILSNLESSSIQERFLLTRQEIQEFFDDISSQESFWLARNPVEKHLEYIHYRISMRRVKNDYKTLDFPLYLLIEPTSVCNLKCPMCFQTDQTFTTKKYMGMMDFNLFSEITKEAKSIGVKAITLASRGEPTLHPRFTDMISNLRNLDFLDLKINTNATKLDERKIRSILENEINEFVLSIDSASSTEYEKLRFGAKFEKTLETVKLLKSLTDEYPNRKTLTRISGVKVHDEQNWDAFYKFWSPYVDQVGWVDSEMRWDTYNNEIAKIDDPCVYPFERLYIWHDGVANPCDVDYKSLLSPGKYPEMNLLKLWENQNSIRLQHQVGDRNTLVPCDRCGVC